MCAAVETIPIETRPAALENACRSQSKKEVEGARATHPLLQESDGDETLAGSWKDLTITGTSAAPSLETTWKLEDAAWSDRDYSWTNLGGFTPGNYKYMAKTGVTARTQSFTITVPTTMDFGVKIVVLSDGASPPPLTTANGWDLTCAGIDKIEGTSNYMTTSVGNLISQLPCTIAMHECHA